MTDDWQMLAQPGGPGLVASQNSPIPDLPMPVGFKPLPGRCEHTFDSIVRTVSHVYQGVGGDSETVTFYRQQLPRHQWNQVRLDTASAPDITLYAVKGREAVRIAIREKNSVTTVTIIIDPRSQTPGPPRQD